MGSRISIRFVGLHKFIFMAALVLITLLFSVTGAYAQGASITDAGVERDARRVEDLRKIKKALDRHAAIYWSYPKYDIQSPAMSDKSWKHTPTSNDFRRRIRNFINPLPTDPINDPFLNFRYVYAFVPHTYEAAPDCAGKVILFAARVETDAARYEECSLGGTEKRILYVIEEQRKGGLSPAIAGTLAPLLNLLSFFHKE